MAAYQYIYTMDRLTKTFPGGKQLFKDIRLSFLPGAHIGVVGENGSGKSTLLKIMAGLDTEIGGEAWAAEGVKVGYLAQEPQLDESKTVVENVMEGVAETKKLLDDFNLVAAKVADDYSDELMEEMSALQEKIDAVDAWSLDHQVEVAMEALRCPPADATVATLSGGEKRRVAICALLLAKPDLLLLDEPTNHLDAETISWLQNYLVNYTGTIVCVTHDRYFLDNITAWILELDRGEGIPYEGNYTNWLEEKAKRLAQEKRVDENRKKTIERELDWVRSSPKARQAKSKARISSFDKLVAQEDSEALRTAQIVIPASERLGGVVIEAEGLSKAFGEKLLIENLDFRLPPGGIVGIIGANGAGKSTLFKMIMKQEEPDAGSIRIGETVQLGYIDQSRDSLDGDKTVWEEISEGNDIIQLGKLERSSRAYCSAFNFKGSDQQKKVGILSGGERNRVHLAKMLKTGANVLLLDEPTNDLDVETLRALEDALMNFAGCAVVITHDRWFLDRVATHILAFEGNSHVEWFEGNFSDYEADKKRRLGSAADRPTRLKFKKFHV
ncbi:MAG: energy-dependent translational throttle protein EttA [OCS116 cluster bacterium]|uniref:Energy-dependent translational throttle protein EttA n=1 Tax=OCS116 cluster bacterium TaxID=2030921 RepID=A0A2A4YZN7_9PROT|nr:energy-dependent translational throttle protein EttA [OCS116 cluster bacterium]